MAKKYNRYKQMELYMIGALAVDTLLFIFYLISAGNGIIWLKVITAILAICVSLLCLGFLYISRELMRQRSLWMTVAASAVLICTVFSLFLNYPSPNPYEDLDFNDIEEQAAVISICDRL